MVVLEVYNELSTAKKKVALPMSSVPNIKYNYMYATVRVLFLT